MLKFNNFFTLHNPEHTNVFGEFPNICPICKNSISPNLIYDYVNEQNFSIYLFFSCPACGKAFHSNYVLSEEKEVYHHINHYKIYLKDSYPQYPVEKKFDKAITKISEEFIKIYNEACAAECYKLNQIAGMGYRKSLEFLIKDYCIYKNPDSSDKIKSKLLGQVIDEYLDSPKIKVLAKASVWIGNDETHYVKKFEDKDINDLKRFITATIAFITYDLTSDEAEDFISE